MARLRIRGCTIRQIPKLLAELESPIINLKTSEPYSRAQIGKDCQALKVMWQKDATREIGEHISDQLALLREAQTVAWDIDDDDKALLRVLQAHDRIAKLLGTNAPERHEIGGPGGTPIPIDLAREQLAARLKRDEGKQ